MNDQTEKLNQALPELTKAVQQILSDYDISEVSIEQLTFKSSPPADIFSDAEKITLWTMEQNQMDIPVCPPISEIHGCIVCRDPATNEIRHICRP
ncbi:hypothetical protein [Spirosoma montaniterrae]|uniref:Uncharacterized protein n=1 Tax=Spirosoma montaniterrae TaxID=1178516 RepID=A0A1P9WW83_9BACT|nr:hypothetical protein [Spirosoma montaniterrae]AQG79623.1 hypothetical protein AWR27_09965 [Spirosoma montaniterrae]